MVCGFKVPHSHLVHKHYVYVDKNKLRPDLIKSGSQHLTMWPELLSCASAASAGLKLSFLS